MMKPLPSGPWEALFPRAVLLIDEIERYGGASDPFWTLGCGTVLMFRHGHRVSKDIDIFVPDPQYLGYVTPRLSDTAASLTEEYTELPSSFVKLQFEEGEIDFVVAPNLTDGAWEPWVIQGRAVRVETAAEVVAKKMFHRGDRATARDLFDLAMVIEREPEALAAAGRSSCVTETGSCSKSANQGRASWRVSRLSLPRDTSRASNTASKLLLLICPHWVILERAAGRRSWALVVVTPWPLVIAGSALPPSSHLRRAPHPND